MTRTEELQAALDALTIFSGETFNGNNDAWKRLGHLIDGHRTTIRSVLEQALAKEEVTVPVMRWIGNRIVNIDKALGQ